MCMKKSKNLNYKQNKEESLVFTQMLKAIDCFPKPTISLVNGHAFGGALGIIAASDYSLSLEKSRFCFSEARLGLIPAMIAPYIMRSISYKTTKKLFLTGWKILNLGVFLVNYGGDTKYLLGMDLMENFL